MKGPVCVIVHSFVAIGRTVAEIWRFFNISKMATVRHLVFVMSMFGQTTKRVFAGLHLFLRNFVGIDAVVSIIWDRKKLCFKWVSIAKCSSTVFVLCRVVTVVCISRGISNKQGPKGRSLKFKRPRARWDSLAVRVLRIAVVSTTYYSPVILTFNSMSLQSRWAW